MSDTDKWYRDYWKRLRPRERIAPTLRARRVHWFWSDGLNEVEQIIFDRCRSCARILDFGAGDLRLKRKFVAAGYSGSYETVDLSTEFEHTYGNISEVTGRFDAIVCLEVIEHMTLNEYVELMDKFGELLNPEGVLIVSTPNPLCVIPTWSLDAGHVQQYPLDDLAADLDIRGFAVEAYRVRLGPRPKQLGGRLRFFSARVLAYLQSVDYCHGLLLIGRFSSPFCARAS